MNIVVIYLLTIVTVIITVSAQAYITSTYNEYSKVMNKRNISGYEAARIVLDQNGLNNIKVTEVKGYLTDHYNPNKKVVALSSNNYHDSSVSSISVACHECGHAIQDKTGYKMMKIRASLVPLVNFSSYMGYLAITLGVLASSFSLIYIGILLECVILLFQIVTLPVEIDASKRALKEIEKHQILDKDEQSSGKTVLIAAALTYVASVATALIQILKLLIIYRRRDE